MEHGRLACEVQQADGAESLVQRWPKRLGVVWFRLVPLALTPSPLPRFTRPAGSLRLATCTALRFPEVEGEHGGELREVEDETERFVLFPRHSIPHAIALAHEMGEGKGEGASSLSPSGFQTPTCPTNELNPSQRCGLCC